MIIGHHFFLNCHWHQWKIRIDTCYSQVLLIDNFSVLFSSICKRLRTYNSCLSMFFLNCDKCYQMALLFRVIFCQLLTYKHHLFSVHFLGLHVMVKVMIVTISSSYFVFVLYQFFMPRLFDECFYVLNTINLFSYVDC